MQLTISTDRIIDILLAYNAMERHLNPGEGLLSIGERPALEKMVKMALTDLLNDFPHFAVKGYEVVDDTVIEVNVEDAGANRGLTALSNLEGAIVYRMLHTLSLMKGKLRASQEYMRQSAKTWGSFIESLGAAPERVPDIRPGI